MMLDTLLSLTPSVSSLLPVISKHSVTGLLPYCGFSAMVILTLAEVIVKLDARFLQISLNKDRYATRKVCLINFCQAVLMVTLVYLKLNSTELKVVSMYSLLAKCIQSDRKQWLADLPAMLTTATFTFGVNTQSSVSVIENVDSFLCEVTFQVLPAVLTFTLLVLCPLILPVILLTILSISVWYVLRTLVILRRKYTEDFDFFITLAICVLVWKTLKRDIRQLQVKSLICSRLNSESLLPGDSSEEETSLVSLEPVLDWCRSRADLTLPVNLVQVREYQGMVGVLRDLEKPKEMSFLQFYNHLNNNFSMINVLSSESIPGGCNLTISQAPRGEGVTGMLRTVLYRIYLMASWILPQSYQSPLSIFGFASTCVPVECDCDCRRLDKLIILHPLYK